jgi:hypothetical protein
LESLAHLPTSLLLAWSLETFFLVVLALTDGYDVARSGEVFRVVLTFVVLTAIFSLVHWLCAGRRRLAFGANFALFLVFIMVNVACVATMGSFNYRLVRDHGLEVLTPLGLHIVVAGLNLGEAALLLSRAPAEEHDIAADPENATELANLRAAIHRIRVNQALLQGNRIWSDPTP